MPKANPRYDQRFKPGDAICFWEPGRTSNAIRTVARVSQHTIWIWVGRTESRLTPYECRDAHHATDAEWAVHYLNRIESVAGSIASTARGAEKRAKSGALTSEAAKDVLEQLSALNRRLGSG